MTLQVDCKKNLRTETGVVAFRKTIKSVLFCSGPHPTWSCRHCSVQWRHARSRYLIMRRYTLLPLL